MGTLEQQRGHRYTVAHMAREQRIVKKCFVIISFQENYDHVYSFAIERALRDKGYSCSRVDENKKPANIQAEIIRNIIDSDIIVADVSENSPNVFYELGISHSVGNKTIVITSKDVNKLPFDMTGFRVIEYRKDRLGLRLLKADLGEAVKLVETRKPGIPSNLVQEAGQYFFDQRKKIDENLTAIAEDRKRTQAYAQFMKRKSKHQDNKEVADEIIGEILNRDPRRRNRLLVSITGAGAVGKSTFSRLLARRLRKVHKEISVDVLSTDSYQLSRGERIDKNIIGFFPQAHDLEALTKDVEKLAAGKEIKVRPYDHKTGSHGRRKTIKPSDVLILEGVYSFYPLIAPHGHGLRYYIFADKHQAKELKFMADFMERGYNIQTAFTHADKEYRAYENHILPFLKLADFVISIDDYWKYKGPYPSTF